MTRRAFHTIVYEHFKRQGRNFPWRSPSASQQICKDKTFDPYKILVSEVMLQQTQVFRVIPRYRAFLREFPTIKHLSRAPLKKILQVWQGLGYNRRALALKRCAEVVVREHKGIIPRDLETLKRLPGVGTYTASAIAAFAYNIPAILIETNIRSVFIHHFFSHKKCVRDSEIRPLVEKTLDRRNPRTWYYALMDYGAMLKKIVTNPSRQSVHHVRQIPFKGSGRELRGRIITLLSKKPMPEQRIMDKIPRFEKQRIRKALRTLTAEGFLTKRENAYSIV